MQRADELPIHTAERPIEQENLPTRIAVIGSGPAGFYAAGHLLGDKERNIEVDMIERLPTPWGLVRSGVAPDHPKIKSVTRVYEKTAAHPRFRYYGNVELGRDVEREDLLQHYHAIVYATGAPDDRPLGVRGEDLKGSWAATDFVGWYNGHPDHRELDFDLSCERAVVIGNGNVALDVARMLTLVHRELRVTDTADHALDALRDSAVSEVLVAGRRGPAQAAFTNPELRELGEMEGVDVIVDRDELECALLGVDETSISAIQRTNLEILRAYAARELRGHRRRIVLRFLLSPIELAGDERGVREVVFARNELIADESGALRAHPTGETETVQAGLVLRAIGYRGRPLQGVPFDERRAVIANVGGRVVASDGTPHRGEYVVGWIKRGPTGVIGTNKKDAQETVDAILEDVETGRLHDPAAPDADSVHELLLARQPELVSYEGWTEIDRHERALGEPGGRPRVKITDIEQMLRIAAAEAPTDEPLDTLGLR
jgi:ferredoxin/flavodoxin---NADP+ reductase